MRSALQRLRIAATHDVDFRDERRYVVLVANGHPHGLGVAVEVRGDLFVRLPDSRYDEEVQTIDLDIVMEWVVSV